MVKVLYDLRTSGCVNGMFYEGTHWQGRETCELVLIMSWGLENVWRLYATKLMIFCDEALSFAQTDAWMRDIPRIGTIMNWVFLGVAESRTHWKKKYI